MQRKSIRVLVVDDSAVMRGLVAGVLDEDPGVEVVTTAANGLIAVNLLKREAPEKLDVDVITLDIQMPEMDGLTALPKILALSPNAKVIMVSSLVEDNAKETMEALSLGAADYIAKPSGSIADAGEGFKRILLEKVKALGSSRYKAISQEAKEAPVAQESNVVPLHKTDGPILLRNKSLARAPQVLAIGSSTGGPQALTSFFKALSGKKFSIPVFITQHMPPEFTSLLSQQIADISGLIAKEGENGDIVKPGHVYIAPGDYHMTVSRQGVDSIVQLNQGAPENFCRPAVDPMLRSIIDVYGGKVLVLILTGMGSDGFLGCQQVVENGGTVVAQDEKTSVVWGMPGAVAAGGLCTEVLPLNALPECIIDLAQGQIL